jgi:hypothetical protein
MNQKAIVAFGIFGVILSLLLGILLIIPWQVAGVLVAVSIGIPTLVLRYEGGKPNVSLTTAQKKHEEKEDWQPAPHVVEIKEHKNTTGSSLLPDVTEITKLRIDNSFLDQIYEEARSKAVNTYDDAKLSYFGVQAFPFRTPPMVNIYFEYYSKWADKTCRFQYSDATSVSGIIRQINVP